MNINAPSLKKVFQGFKAVFTKALQAAEPEWSKIAMMTTSSSASEIYGWLGAVPGMKKLVGESIIENLSTSNFAIINDEFDATMAVKRAEIERDTFGIHKPLVESIGLAAAQHPDELVGVALSQGFSQKDYTGKPFYANDKPHEPENKKSTKFSNKMTKALTAESFSEAKAMLKSIKNNQGRSMKLGKKLLLIVPPALEDAALRLLRAEKVEGGDTNVQMNAADLLVYADLETDTEWHLIDCGHPVKPIIYQVECPIEFNSQTDPTSDTAFLKKEYLYQAYGRYNVGYGLPQLAVGSTGADAAPQIN